MNADTPLSGWQKSVLYFLDNRITMMSIPTRRITIHNGDIARALRTNKRRVVHAIGCLEKRGWVKRKLRYAEHGGSDANEYAVMPVNPRKRKLIESVAESIGHDPFEVMAYVAQSAYVAAVMGDSFDQQSLPEYETNIGYKCKDKDDHVGRLINAASEHQLDLRAWISDW